MNVRSLTRRQRVLLFVGCTLVLPVILVLALLLQGDYARRQAEIEQASLANANEILALADARVESDLRVLRVLAAGRAFQQRDWPEAKRRAGDVVDLIAGWNAVTLGGRSGERLIFGTAYSSAQAGRAPAPPIDAENAPVLGVEREGDHCPCVRLSVPLPSAPDLWLTAFIDPNVFQSLLLDRLPQDAVAGLVDRDARFLARSIDFAERVGTPGTNYVRDAVLRGGQGLYAGRTYEGLVNYTAYATSPWTGWSTHVAIDRRLIDGPRSRSAGSMLIGAIVTLALASALIGYALYDLATRRREEERLLQMQKAEAISQFTNMIVHDFRNLLAVMQSGLNQIAAHTQEAETQKLAALTRGVVDRGARLTKQLLNFARDNGGEIGAVDIAALLGEMEDLLNKCVGGAVELKLLVDPDVGWALVNRDQFELALVNLAVNARDAMGEKGGEFSIRARRADGAVELRITDTGPGVLPEVRDSLFEPMVTTKPPDKGSGLGLAQVAGAVRGAGGAIELDTRSDQGAAFVLRLRIAEEQPRREHSTPALETTNDNH